MADEKDTKDAVEETATPETTEEVKEEAAPADSGSEESPKEEAKEESAPATDEAADEGEEVEVPEKFQQIVSAIEEMSVLDLHELVKLFEKKFGVSAAAVAVAGGAGAAGDAGGEEQSSFTVELADAGASKIGVIKAVKEILGLGLAEAKGMVEGVPTELKKDIAKAEAEEMKAKLEEAGAKVNLK
ncbi:MAG: 50S ribosomal protein L7/L12 [Parcubacteria group bacterium]|nr:50S ribosomal protein L7/L12 [Parcubacteria group bacterium]